jgi:hypothetical protein
LAESVWEKANGNILDLLEPVEFERYHRVRFEELVSQSRQIMVNLCDFLGVPYNEEVLQPYKGRRMSDGLGDPNFQDQDRIESKLGDVWKNIKLPRRLGRAVRQLAAELDYDLEDEAFSAGKVVTAEGVANTPQSGSLARHSLVGIQTKGSNRPFFCVHPVDGKVFCYTELARCLGTAQPFYGLQSPSLDGSGVVYTKIEEMAAHYLEEIRQVQSESPYILGGWSMGGIVAFEMAQQLRRCEEEVALFVFYNRDTRSSLRRKQCAPPPATANGWSTKPRSYIRLMV